MKTIWVAVLALLLMSSALYAEDPKETFDALFGDMIKKAEATGNTTDDVKLAGELYDSAKGMAEHPEVAKLCFKKAIELGAKAKDGYETAIDAAAALKELNPDAEAEIAGMIFKVHEARFSRAPRAQKQEAAMPYYDAIVTAAEGKVKAGDTNEAMRLYRKAMPLTRYLENVSSKDITDRIKEV